MTPVAGVLFGFKPAVAVGTDLLYAAITKSAGVFVHHGEASVGGLENRWLVGLEVCRLPGLPCMF